MKASYFGRDAELNEGKALLDQMLAGRGAMLLVGGEPGIGKSRLGEELAVLAAQRGAQVHYGRGWEGGGAPVYWPWTEALTSLAAGLSAEQLSALAGEDAPELVRLWPELLRRLPSLEAASLPEADEGRFRLARAVAATLRRAAATRPLMLVLDDLHLADASTLSCLQWVGRQARGMRLLLVGTYREAETRLSPALAESIGVLSREATTLSLSALSHRAALELIHAQSALAEDVAASIASVAAGNPLFLTEMSRLVASRGKTAARELPLGVKESIRQRFALLPTAAVEVLEAAACAGREFDVAMVACALGVVASKVADPLDLAVKAGMVETRGGERRAFSHDLLREVLYQDMPRAKRMRLHQQIASVLRRSATAGNQVSAIAHHLLEASELDPEPAIRAAIEAATAALGVVAYEEALALLERAQAVAHLPRVPAALVAELWLILGEARIRAGQVATAKDACKQAMAIARQLDDVVLMARAALTWGAEIQPGTIDRELVEWLREADQRLAGGDITLRARVKGRLAAALQPSVKPLEPVAMAHEAIALARESADDRTLLEVIHSAMAAMMEYEHPKSRLPLNLEQEALARRFHDRPRELRARLRLFFDYLVMGDVAYAEQRAVSFDVLAKELKQTRFAWLLPSWRASRATFEGRFDEVPALLDAARESSPPTSMAMVRDLMQRVTLMRAKEEAPIAPPFDLDFGLRANDMEMGDFVGHVFEVSSVVRGGDVERGRVLFAALKQRAFSSAYKQIGGLDAILRFDPMMMTGLADALALIGEPELSREGYSLLLPWRGLQVHHGLIGMAWEGPMDRVLGLLAMGAGNVEQAIEHHEAAVANLKALGGRGFLARSLFEAAEARERRGTAADRSVAVEYVKEARAVAMTLGQGALLTLFEKRVSMGGPLAAAAPQAGPPASARAAALSLTQEGDFWLVQGGDTAFRLKDSRGLQLLARLVERPDQEVHCLELVSDGPKQELEASDAGEWLDAEAKRQYQARVEDLRDSLKEAEAFGDARRAEKARAELEFIAAELSRGVGLGGRSRKAGSTAERARVAVQRRLKDAVQRIAENDAALGRHLEWALKTGTYCCYRSSA